MAHADGDSVIGPATPSGTITEFTVPTASSYPYGITAGPDGPPPVTTAPQPTLLCTKTGDPYDSPEQRGLMRAEARSRIVERQLSAGVALLFALASAPACARHPSAPTTAPVESSTAAPLSGGSLLQPAALPSTSPSPAVTANAAVPVPDADAGPCAGELAAFAARGGALGLEGPGMTSVDTWDQDCQWRVEDLESASMRFWADRRGRGDAGADEVVAYARNAVASDLTSPEFVNGAMPPDKLAQIMRRVHIASCLAGASGVPPRLRVRFTVPSAGGAPQHVATDYRVPVPLDAQACIARQITAQTFPPLELGKWAIIVRALDTRR